VGGEFVDLNLWFSSASISECRDWEFRDSTFPNSPTYPILFPFKVRKSGVMPLPFRKTTPVNGSSRREPMDKTGKPRALAYFVSVQLVPSTGSSTHGKSMDHGLEAQIDLPGPNNLGHILLSDQ
jgi:hypothetical protein